MRNRDACTLQDVVAVLDKMCTGGVEGHLKVVVAVVEHEVLGDHAIAVLPESGAGMADTGEGGSTYWGGARSKELSSFSVVSAWFANESGVKNVAASLRSLLRKYMCQPEVTEKHRTPALRIGWCTMSAWQRKKTKARDARAVAGAVLLS